MGAALVTGLTAATGCRREPSAASPAPSPAWASGGTSAMRAKASYPDPFAGSARSPACKATCELTLGPCYSSQAEAREDISYGAQGLPMRLCLQVLDEACAPVAGALVDVWHVSPGGKYSGNDAEHEEVGFCTGDDPTYRDGLYFRGKQTTDAAGKVGFDTCFPGWYHGRTVHVHLTISVRGESFVTTQLCFDDALVDEIVATQPGYGGRGARDARNTSDGVFGARTYGDYLVTTARMSDGAMLASKTLQLRRSTSEPICQGGGDRPGGPRGPGGPGGPGRPHRPPPESSRPGIDRPVGL